MRYLKSIISVLAILSVLGVNEASSQVYLSEQAEISLVTCDPGTEIYSVFGHTAIRVTDPVNGFDLVYNFGTFDFNTPNFYLKFIRGRLMYTLSRYNFSDFRIEYMMANRSIYEQRLNLSPQEKQKIFYLLEVHFQPENRYYLYDFFFTNCTTKVLDLIESAIDDPGYFSQYNTLGNRTFRQNLGIYLEVVPWVSLGGDLMLGIPSDKTMTVRESMYLPLELMHRVDLEKGRDLFNDIQIVFKADAGKTSSSFRGSPNIIFWGILLLVLILTFIEFKRKIRSNWPDKILFSIFGLFGILFTLLWAFSDHGGMNYNLSILWAFPLHFPVFLCQRYLGKRVFRVYLLITGILLASVLLFWNIIPQEFNATVFPLVLILLIRSFSIYWKLRKKVIT